MEQKEKDAFRAKLQRQLIKNFKEGMTVQELKELMDVMDEVSSNAVELHNEWEQHERDTRARKLVGRLLSRRDNIRRFPATRYYVLGLDLEDFAFLRGYMEQKPESVKELSTKGVNLYCLDALVVPLPEKE